MALRNTALLSFTLATLVVLVSFRTLSLVPFKNLDRSEELAHLLRHDFIEPSNQRYETNKTSTIVEHDRDEKNLSKSLNTEVWNDSITTQSDGVSTIIHPSVNASNVIFTAASTITPSPSPGRPSLPPNLMNVTRLFTPSRLDRSGMAVLNALLGHAYAHYFGLEYGGICDNQKKRRRASLPDHRHLHRSVIEEVWGLGKILPWNVCPQSSSEAFIGTQTIGQMGFNTKLMTKEWVELIRSSREEDNTTLNDSWAQGTQGKRDLNDTTIRISVHIRRGDVSPCRWNNRYVPNLLYKELIPQVIETSVKRFGGSATNLTIFTEDESFEPIDDFIDMGYRVVVGGDIHQVWRAMDASDVLIVGASSFSFIPAVLSKRVRQVVYLPFEYEPLDGWQVIDDDLWKKGKDWVGKHLRGRTKDRYCSGLKPLKLYNTTIQKKV